MTCPKHGAKPSRGTWDACPICQQNPRPPAPRCWNCGGEHHPNDCPEAPRVDPKLNADGTAGCNCAE